MVTEHEISHDGDGQHRPLERTTRLLARRKGIILLCLVLVPAAALVWSLTREERFTATASLLFREQADALLELSTTAPDEDPARKAATNEELVALPVVADRAAEALGGGLSGGSVAANIEVSSSELSDVTKIEATSATPGAAANLANAYARAYVDFRRTADTLNIANAIKLIETSIAALPPARAASPEAEELRGRLERLTLARSLQTGDAELVQEASAPSSPSSPKTQLNVILGLFGGALLGLALAGLFERLDRRLGSVAELGEAFELPVLAQIPRTRSAALSRRSPGRLDESVVEAYRALRVNLRYFSVDREIRTLLVASPLSKDGKSTIALNLATTMSSMGDDVVLVQADLRKPSNLLGSVSSPGLSGMLIGAAGLDDALIDVDVELPSGEAGRLPVLPSGPLPPNPSQLLESEQMRTLLRELESRFHTVVLDSPALKLVSDAWALVPEVSGVLVVGAVNRTTRHAAVEFTKQLNVLGGGALGVVANFARSEGGYRYDSGYYYTTGHAVSRERVMGPQPVPSPSNGEPEPPVGTRAERQRARP